jgi:transcriptional regulator with XRE-family HTH domain
MRVSAHDVDAASEARLIAKRRAELGRFLRQRRSRVQPHEIGIANVGRRHVRGLRRDEVAAAANIGLSWYTMLEQGRVENVSTRTLDAVADALRLDASERGHLRSLAARSFEELAVDDSPPPATVLDFVRTFRHGGAFVHSSSCDMLAWNAWADAFFGFSSHGPAPNLLDIMFGDAAIRARFVDPDWLEIVRRMIGHVRLRYGNAGGEHFETTIARLRAYPEFRAIWEEHPVKAPPSEYGVVDHPVHGKLDTDVIAFVAPASPTYTIVLIVPGQRASARDADDAAPPVPAHATAVTHEGRTWRRRDLGGFLRHRRERMRPEEVGVVRIGRRHAKGLRRDEVAQIAGIGVSWYTMLEQGRVENVRPRTLNAVANALRLTPREHAYLRNLAAQSFAELSTTALPPRPELVNFVERYSSGGAHLHDARFELVTWNGIADELYDFSRLPSRNILVNLAREHAFRDRFAHPDWRDLLVRITAYFRFSSAYGDVDQLALIDELCAACPEFERAWAGEPSVSEPDDHTVVLRSGDGLLRLTCVTVLVPCAAPTYTLVLTNETTTG